MNPKRRVKVSKLMSYGLRHQPDDLGLVLDDTGWTDVDALLAAIGERLGPISREELVEIVATSPKQRFALSDDGTRIRANQGHSVGIDLGLAPSTPPEFLFHGTPAKAVESIRETGLERRGRDHVHLSPDRETATIVGARRGSPAILVIRALEMARAGHVFYRSDNGVWLIEAVPPHFIDFES